MEKPGVSGLRNLEYYVNECQQELRVLGIPFGETEFRVNTRFKLRWGQCRYDFDRDLYVIDISAVLLEEYNPVSALKNTIIHELLHACPFCMNHGNSWYFYANKVNQIYNYNIKATTTAREYGVTDTRKTNCKTYQLRCQTCGYIICKFRMCKVVKNPEQFRCSRCGGRIAPFNYTK